MFDYYHYFVDKGNHPLKQDILNQEKEIDLNKLVENKDYIKEYIINNAPKRVGIRIIIDNKIELEYLDESLNEESLKWLARKEKTVISSKHSSYYTFLDNIESHNYDYMIDDENYGICGGSYPLYHNGLLKGTITVTGCRPNEDHQLIIDALTLYKLI